MIRGHDWLVGCASVLLACVGGGSGAKPAPTLSSACSDACEVRVQCGGDPSGCQDECEASLPANCATQVADTIRCLRALPESARCAETPPTECADQYTAQNDCIQGGDGTPLPAEPELGNTCIPSETCSGALQCIDYDAIGPTCTLACDIDGDCPENGLCLLFDSGEGHVCVRACETNADCEGTLGGMCIVGGEQLLGRTICQ